MSTSLYYLTGVSSLTELELGESGVMERMGAVMRCNESGTILIAGSPVKGAIFLLDIEAGSCDFFPMVEMDCYLMGSFFFSISV